MNTPDTEARLRVLEYEVQTLRTLLTALQGRVAELSTSTPAPEAQELPQEQMQLYEISYPHVTLYVCHLRITNALIAFPNAVVTWLGRAAPNLAVGCLGSLYHHRDNE